MKKLKMVIPKGRLSKKIISLLNDAGLGIEEFSRHYKPRCSYPDIEIKIMKPQNIPQLLQIGSHDLGFAGKDWVDETRSEVTEILDLGFDPVKIVSAIPDNLSFEKMRNKKIVVASEYVQLTKDYLDSKSLDYIFIRTYGATEVFPPEDADMIIDNTSTGNTLKTNKLKIIDTIKSSTTRMIANPEAMKDKEKRQMIETIKMLIVSVLNARERVMLEMNIRENLLDNILKNIPCMKSPTIARLYNEGYSLKIAVKKDSVASLIPQLKKLGATDILETEFRKVIL